MSAPIASATNCFRIGTPQWLPESRHRELLEMLDRHPDAAGEVTYFTSETHPPLPLDVMQERAEILAGRMREAREHGLGAGINILSTIGHHDENLPHSLDIDSTRVTDIAGKVCRGSYCPNDERFDSYVRDVYIALAEAGPEHIWIDDDVRLAGHTPIYATCFCDNCVDLFSARTGCLWTRETLRTAFAGEAPVALALRTEWLAKNRETIAKLFRLIEKTVHGIDAAIELGFMTGERYLEGYDFDTWADILSGPDSAPVRWRPGAGTYTDERLDGIVEKAHDIGRQVALLPESVTVIQSEIENFPYQRLRKSEHATALEAAAYIAAGCTGAAYNVLSMYDEPLDEYEPLVRRLREARPFLDNLARQVGRTPPVGVAVGWTKNSSAAVGLGNDWTESVGPRVDYANEMWCTGLPAAYAPMYPDHLRYAPVVALTGDLVPAIPDDVIESILSRGVYLDGEALEALNARGHGSLTGFACGRSFTIDGIERLTDHPLNAPFAGRPRNRRQSFWPETAYELHPAEGAETLARLVDYADDEMAACCGGVYENRLGGRVATWGYSPWSFLQSESVATRLKALVRWLSRDTLPGYVASYHRVIPWIREPEPGRLNAVLMNASLDVAEVVVVALRTTCDEIVATDENGDETRIQATGVDSGYRAFVLPAMAPWSMLVAETT